MPRRVLMSALLFAVLALVSETPARMLAAHQAGAPPHDVAKSPLSLQVGGMPTSIRLGDEFSFTLTVRNDGTSAVDMPTSTRRALGRGHTPDLRAVVSLFPADGRNRPLVFAFTALVGSRSSDGSIRTMMPGEAADLEVTARLGLRSVGERQELRPLLPRDFAARVRFGFHGPPDRGVWYPPTESTPFQIRIEPPGDEPDQPD